MLNSKTAVEIQKRKDNVRLLYLEAMELENLRKKNENAQTREGKKTQDEKMPNGIPELSQLLLCRRF